MKRNVYKIAKFSDWCEATGKGYYAGSADDIRDGYIHLSAEHQLRGTLEKHFRGEADLVLIALEEDKLGPPLRWEQSRGGEMFPHLYGVLSTSPTLWERGLTLGDDGVPRFDLKWFQC